MHYSARDFCNIIIIISIINITLSCNKIHAMHVWSEAPVLWLFLGLLIRRSTATGALLYTHTTSLKIYMANTAEVSCMVLVYAWALQQCFQLCTTAATWRWINLRITVRQWPSGPPTATMQQRNGFDDWATKPTKLVLIVASELFYFMQLTISNEIIIIIIIIIVVGLLWAVQLLLPISSQSNVSIYWSRRFLKTINKFELTTHCGRLF